MASYDVILKDRTIEVIDGADAYQQEGQMTTFFATSAGKQVVDCWSTRLASFRTSEILINFAGANIAMFGAYICWAFATKWGWPVWVSIIVAMAIITAGGAATERVLIRPFDPTDHLPVVLIRQNV